MFEDKAGSCCRLELELIDKYRCLIRYRTMRKSTRGFDFTGSIELLGIEHTE
jgi:hypothetical protein